MRTLARVALAFTVGLTAPPPPGMNDGQRSEPGLEARDVEARLPLHFEPNRGQAPAAVRFLARAAGYDTFLMADGARIALRANRPGAQRDVRAIDIRFTGGSAAPHLDTTDPLPGTVNYLRGSNPAGWQVGLPTFGKVRYRAMYPGIDLVFYGNGRQLEYDVVVAPGADHHQVRIAFDGVDGLRIDDAGDLLLQVGERNIVQRRPVAYQITAAGRQPIEARYATHGKTEVGFAIGAYDPTLPLVIDPVLVYSTYLGGSSYDTIIGVATDSTGHVYVTGTTSSADFPTTAGAYDRTLSGSLDGFVSKVNPSGTALVYSTVFGGTSVDRGHDVAVDAAGQAHVTGHTVSPDFPVTAGAPTCAGGDCGFDAFAVKLNAAGSGLLYAARLSGSDSDSGLGIALDDDGSAVIVGQTRSTNFPVSGGAYQPAKRGDQYSDDYFVTKLNAAGTTIVYSTYFGGSYREDGLARVAIDADGNAYLGAETQSGDFPTLNARQDTLRGDRDGVVASFGPFGHLRFSTYLGGSGLDGVGAIAVDADGAAYVTGRTMSADFPLVMPADSTFARSEAFVTKFMPGGAVLAYSTFLGGTGEEQGRGIAVDGAGHAHVTLSAGTDFPTTADGAAPTEGGAFYVRLNATGANVTFASYIGPAFPQDLALDASGNVYIGGQTLTTTMTLRNAMQSTPDDDGHGFLARFGEWPPPSSPDDIVLYAARAATVAGAWRRVNDPNAGGYAVLHHPDAGAAKLSSALPAPAHYFELTFTPQINRPYRLWIRGKAERDHWSNDSVFVQFSDSVTASGTPTYRIGTTGATAVNLEDCVNCGVSGWGWQDNGYGAGVLGPVIYFASATAQTIRVQTREDGMMIDQIVLSPATWLTTAPGALKRDTTVLRDDNGDGEEPPAGGDVVLHATGATLTGNWRFVADSTAASGQRAWNPNANIAKRTTALASPPDYVELTFTAQAGRAYRLWIRGKAENDYWGNDSLHVQFSGSVDARGTPVYRIGTMNATQYNLESCSGCGLSGWGWEDNGWGTGVLGPLLYFAADGPQTIRLQVREDGLSFDQIILSPERFMTTAPGAAKQDATIYPQQP